jgi:AbrB family looped-hinge helix DNA binding protein
MANYEALMSSKGQVTIPAKVREHLRLKEGDKLDFYIEPDRIGVRIIARNRSLKELKGLFKKVLPAGAPTPEPLDIDKAIGEHLAEKHARISREWNEWEEFQQWKSTRAAE